ncbi:hypothetical protein SCP_0603500 [Sparassis crispa]|uniref:CxC2-like cysteine cluster KDZ transposase-associated domain-containing protein n=1 Tax=Sparassis crispa TaxID=139825 RepID=A0A401GQ61_9APHY|nr:hypothetical protein SCP_0603500 [Sparassis crispa]GBE84371.1 hypothetical protein SCP_0603500 [Sparassis crispa]
MRIMHMWWHLKMLKRAGRGHDPGGVRATTPGSCVVLCPACPHPGKNLRPDWEEAPENEKWLYQLFIGLNANFRLKCKKVSSDSVDPGLNHGYAYFVEERAYKEYLSIYDSLVTEEQSMCNNHDAVKLANMRGSVTGTAASGVGAVTCTRHDMRLPCSVSDLQKGEWYVNMDYMFFSTLANVPSKDVVISYDIACQWHKNLWKWYQLYKSCPFKKDDHDFVFLIPKFHINAHQKSCQDNYSFHHTLHVGEMDGEGVERPYSDSNLYSSSTKEIGPGSRCNFLDDAFTDYNWRKVCGMPTLFLVKIKAALPEHNKQVLAFAELNDAMVLEDWNLWRNTVKTWEKDSSKLNPVVATCPTVTQVAVHLQLANEEAVELENGVQSGMVHDLVSPSVMIMAGIELQEQQYHLRHDIVTLGAHSTDLQCAKMIER